MTLEGELINPGGSMTGGAFKNSSNLLSRRGEIEEFEKTVVMLKKEMDTAEEEVNGSNPNVQTATIEWMTSAKN